MKQTAVLYLLWSKNGFVLFNYLSQKPRVVLTLAQYCNDEVKREIELRGSRLLILESLLTKSEIDKLKEASATRAEQCKALMTDASWINWRNRFSSDPSITDAIILQNFAQHLFEGVVIVEMLEKVHQQFFLELVLVNEDYMQLSKTVVCWAKTRNIPSLHLTHALQLAKPYTVHGQLSADVVAVFGERGAEPYYDLGIPPDRIRITGNPAWDIYALYKQKRELLRKYVIAKYTFDPEAPILLFGTTSRGEHSALADDALIDNTLITVFQAYAELRKTGFSLNLIIKDRESNVAFGRNLVMAAASEAGVLPNSFAYVTSETEIHITAADVVVSVDSNLTVEAMLAEVPAINLINEPGVRLGPIFDGGSGIVEVEPNNLVNALVGVLYDTDFRAQLLEASKARVHYYNAAIGGTATEQVTKLMGEMALDNDTSARPSLRATILSSPARKAEPSVYDALGASSATLMEGHPDTPRIELIAMFERRPQRVLDIGCNRGDTGAAIKEKFPEAEVIGIEVDKAAAEVASRRIDRVINEKIDGINWANVGIEPNSIDTVIIADVLEHFYDPWSVLANLKKVLTPDAQILAGMPNVRNLWLMDQLAQGRWSCEHAGLSDMTHIRFFTLEEMKRAFRETGYAMTKIEANKDGRVVIPSMSGNSVDIETDKIIIKNATPEEVFELSALQFFMLARPSLNDVEDAGYVKHAFKKEEPREIDRNQQEYQAWRSKRSLQEIDAQLFAERMTLVWKARPVFQIVLILAPGEASLLADTLDSLGAQFYPDWRLTVIAGFPAPDAVFHELAQLRWIEARTAAERVAAMNVLIAGADTGWLLLAPPGAVLEPHALIRCGDYVNLHPEWRLIYCDDDRVNAAGEFAEPRFKPDFNLDFLRSTDYIGPCLFRADALGETGGYSILERAETYDMTLRVLDQYGEQAIGHVEDVLLHLPSGWDAIGSEENAREAVNQHLVRQGIQGRVDEGYVPGTHRVVYERVGNPLVSIIIPNRDKLEFLEPCVESVLEKTSYADYEILIVDNQSTDPDVLDYYEELRQRFPGRLRVLSFDAEFNFAAMNNLAAREAKGEYLLLLNNDTQIVQGEWLERLLSYGQRPDVGIVGARLVYPESGKLQHAGVVLGMSGLADHPFNGALSISEPGYMNRAQVDQNYSTVTAACLLVRKSVYEQVGGMDEERLKVLYNDIDLCLKVRELGYKIVWTPYATAVHHGSTSLKSESVDLMKLALGNERWKREQRAMMERWLPQLANDPAYNRHLSFKTPGYQVEGTVVIDWDTNFHDRPRFLATPLSGGSGEYRVIGPFRALSRAGLAQCDVIQAGQMFKTRVLRPVEIERAKPNTLVLHSAIDDMQMEALASYKQFNQDVLRVFALDDLMTQIPKENAYYRYSYRDAKPRMRKALALCDRAVVSTEPLAALCRPMIEEVHVIPNRLERALWGEQKSLRRQGAKPRVGWAGAQQHAGDLALIEEVVKATASEVDWVFFGMCPDTLRPYVREFHDFVLSFYDYPAKLASLNLDLAVAPLELHPFNEAKSNLRLLEYGILGWPVVCTDIYPYQNAPVARVTNNDPQAWIDAIRERVHDLDAAAREGDQLKQWVLQNYMLEDHLDEWLRTLVR